MIPQAVATIALQGASAALAFELAVRSAYLKKREKNTVVKIGKLLLGVFMTIKACLFLSFHKSLWQECNVVGRLADLFYHLAVTAGTLVLLERVQSVMPITYRTKALIFHGALVFIRLIIGIVDVVLVHMDTFVDGICKYTVKEYWGPIYTFYDTFVDFYVSIIISMILISHIRSLKSDSLRGNTILYTSVIYNNVMRTVCLTAVNFMSAILIIVELRATMLLWPIINILFVVLIGYDSDVTKTIQRLRQKDWQAAAATTSGTVVNAALPTISEPHQAMRRVSAKRCLFEPTLNYEMDNISLFSTEDWVPATVITAEHNERPAAFSQSIIAIDHTDRRTGSDIA